MCLLLISFLSLVSLAFFFCRAIVAALRRVGMGVKGLKKLAHQKAAQCKRPIFKKRDTREHKKARDLSSRMDSL